MEIQHISRWRFLHTVGWAVLVCLVFVVLAAALGRAAMNMKAALTDKPDIAIYLLLPDEHIGKTVLLRERDDERDYLADTDDGQKLIKLKHGEHEWYVYEVIPMRQ